MMDTVTVELDDDLVTLAHMAAADSGRTVGEQIEYWARLGRAVERLRLSEPQEPAALPQTIEQYVCDGTSGAEQV